jgi:hypothetical protein
MIAMSDKWEYQLITLATDRDPSQIQVTLNAAGNDSWELVAVYPSAAAFNIFVFKRQKSEA